jgi:PAS domain-containing protein
MQKFMGPDGPGLRPGDNYEDLVRKTLESDVEIVDGRDKKQWERDRLAQIRSPDRTESELHYANGSWVLAIEQKTPTGEIMALRIDISRLKKAEEALQASRERQRLSSTSRSLR